MSDRKEGWYWVKDDAEGWHPAQWLGRWCSPFVIQHGGLRDSDYLDIGPRILTPDETEGWQVVPKEATLGMLNEGRRKMFGRESGPTSEVYRAMLQAAPKPGEA